MRSESGSGRNGSSGGAAVSRGGASGAGGVGGVRSATGRGSANSTARGTGSATAATPPADGSRATARDGSGRNGRTIDATDGVPSYARPRDGKPAIGTATPRTSAPGGGTSTGSVYVPAGYYGGGLYDPYGFGLGTYGGYGYGGYYGGYYDPWYGGYPTYQSNAVDKDEGALRLKIKPREAEVYVDGYYVGIVDDFDGIFQRLHVESGPHRVEVRAPGYEALAFDVRITTDQSTTYQGELKKIQ
jgi:hypothetical protein